MDPNVRKNDLGTKEDPGIDSIWVEKDLLPNTLDIGVDNL